MRRDEADSIVGFITGPSNPKVIGEIGNRYGRLTVVARVASTGASSNRARWLCRCDCGGAAEVLGTNLRQGMQKSCGCLRVELAKQVGGEHPAWKGDDVGYRGLHSWVRKQKTKTGVCQHCDKQAPMTDWANVSGEYLRDLDDFIELCRACHGSFDRSKRETARS